MQFLVIWGLKLRQDTVPLEVLLDLMQISKHGFNKKQVSGLKQLRRFQGLLLKKDPQAAFIAVLYISMSLQNEWTYIQRVVNTDEEAFMSLKDALCITFLPQICGFAVNDLEADVMLRPARFGGVGIYKRPCKISCVVFQNIF